MAIEIEKNKEQNNEKRKTCFIITPIGPEGSEIRREIEGIIDEVINPVLMEMGYETNNVAHRKDSTSSIPSDVIKSVYDADLCIANLTGNNANVMYELALRHAAGKHVIIITNNISSLPFDINVQRAIEYKNDMQGALELKRDLKLKIRYINEHFNEISNPIYDNLQKIVISDDSIPNLNISYRESIEKILNDISELKKMINKNNEKINFPLGYAEIIRSHNYEMDAFKRDIDLYTKGNDFEQLDHVIDSLHTYINTLENSCNNVKKRKDDAVYNSMYQEAVTLLEKSQKTK